MRGLPLPIIDRSESDLGLQVIYQMSQTFNFAIYGPESPTFRYIAENYPVDEHRLDDVRVNGRGELQVSWKK